VLNPVLKKRLILAFKITIVLAVIGWVGWELCKLHDRWDEIREHQWNTNYLYLTLAGICYIIAYLPAAIYWRHVMQTLGQQPRWYETLRAYYIGHLAKYIPGKMGVLVVRVTLLNHKRTKISVAGASVFVETMTIMAVGAFVATLTLLIAIWMDAPWLQHFDHFHIDWLNPEMLLLVALGTMICTMLPILPPVFHFITRKLKKYQIELEGMKFRTLALGWMLNIPIWIMLGFSLWLTMRGLGMESQSFFAELLFCTAAISVSIVVGFASMLPAGLGAREMVLRHLLILFLISHPVAGLDAPVMALVIALVFRLISILAELAISAVFALQIWADEEGRGGNPP